jgi:hypothetical protein
MKLDDALVAEMSNQGPHDDGLSSYTSFGNAGDYIRSPDDIGGVERANKRKRMRLVDDDDDVYDVDVDDNDDNVDD